MSIPQFSNVSADQQLRAQALQQAQNNATPESTDDEILEAAKKYYKFLKGVNEDGSSDS